MSAALELLRPDWPAPAQVRAAGTTRAGGVSVAPYASFNLASHVGDEPAAVAANRARLMQVLDLPAAPHWLNQVHGRAVVRLGADTPATPDADAAVAFTPGRVCAVLTADCLPVLFCDRAGTRVAAAHAGWRGLAGGVLEATVAALDCAPEQLLAWLGPAIGPRAFEVGDEVRAQFVAHDPRAAAAFLHSAKPPSPKLDSQPRWLADLYALARLRLAHAGVTAVYGGGECTYTDAARFYSYRREACTGRMASLIWLSAS